ncbi:tRNA pseudouridine(55) synthase TruB [Oceanobacillus halotolerans]|uniref:tRNA pseudouridine(55) synthase TruB n=1 Tax=Oceanobacillus halotolerans TaxID=2663380 RepID=UPI0013DAD841|nr:tRNA pseudouridine(55) synthase TruB [Oceanobacillus halotolerans]
MDGILPLWKPKGMTSHDCVVKIRKLFGTKKVGHTGTLDPEVEGVLPICIGAATKIVPFLTDTKKTYIAELELGSATDTEDAQGEIIKQKSVANMPSKQIIENMLQSFKGKQIQIPPMYSAVKVNGKKLYEYARANETVERPTREITIYTLDYLDHDPKHKRIKFKVVCSKGTYIRTLCVDIGKALGYPAHMSDLTRTATGSITSNEACSFDVIEKKVQQDQAMSLLLPLTEGLSHLDRVDVDSSTKEKVLHGQKLKKTGQLVKSDPFMVMYGQQLLAIYQKHPTNSNEIKPVRVFPVG